MWQSRHPEVDVYVLALCEQIRLLTWSPSAFSSASLSWSERLTDTGTQLESRSPCSYIGAFAAKLGTFSISWTLEPNCCSAKTSLPFLTIGFLVFVWVCWESLPPPATSEPSSFIQLSVKEIFGGSRGDAYTFLYDFFRFHHDSLRDTISWKRIVKDDCVRSCLTELKSFLLSKLDVNPIHRVLMCLPLFLPVPCKTWCIQANFIWISMFFFLPRRHCWEQSTNPDKKKN